jgi:hypothetical protein
VGDRTRRRERPLRRDCGSNHPLSPQGLSLGVS